MAFLDKKHRDLIQRIEQLWKGVEALSELGREYGIDDIFQDNGAKILQQVIYLNFKALTSREGNDAIDENGVEWELKSCNSEKVVGISTHHHLNHVILAKYRTVPWIFSIYEHTVLKEMYMMTPDDLEPIFTSWETKLNGEIKAGKKMPPRDSLNNPKIPINFVKEHGVKVFPFPTVPVNPSSIAKKIKKIKN